MSYSDLPPLRGMRPPNDLYFPTDLVSLVDDVQERIPGLKTSAAFFSSLRQNLHLHDAPSHPSPVSTPRLNPRSSFDVLARQPPSLPLAAAAANADLPVTAKPQSIAPQLLPSPILIKAAAKIVDHSALQTSKVVPATSPTAHPRPPITITTISSLSGPDLTDARSAAVLLLKHSLASDQTLLALRSLATHPLNIALLALLLITIRVLVPRSAPLSLLFAIYTWLAGTLALVAALGVYWPLRCAAAEIANTLAAGPDDEILVARWLPHTHSSSPSHYADDSSNASDKGASSSEDDDDDDAEPNAGRIVGILVLSTRTTQSHSPSASSRSSHHRRQARGSNSANCIRVRASIRAWTVHHAYRGVGVGEALLRAAYAGVARRGGGGAGGEAGELAVGCGHVFAHDVAAPAGCEMGAGVRGLARVLGSAGGLYGGLAERREQAVRERVRIAVERVREERAAEGRMRRNSGGKK